MIFIVLGSQDKKFYRLLDTVSKQLDNKVIKEEVVVQAGVSADYKDSRMKIFDFISHDEMIKITKEAKYIICHGGVGTIIDCLNQNKKIIVAPRLKKYKEHTNDHQLQIIEKFYEKGYILKLDDFNKLDIQIKKINDFKPKKYISNKEKFINLVDNIIKDL